MDTEDPTQPFSSSSAQGKRDYQEDSVVTKQFTVLHASRSEERDDDHDDDEEEEPRKRWTLLGVFDGHSSSKKIGGGGQVSRLATTLIPALLERQLQHLPSHPDPESLAQAIRASFVEFDSHLQKLSIQDVSSVFGLLPPLPKTSPINFDRAGSCACVVLASDDYLCIANLGDSQCVIGCPKAIGNHDGVAFVTPVHQCSNAKERRRIAAAGGFIEGNRVGGILIPTRGFGDFRFKKDDDDASKRESRDEERRKRREKEEGPRSPSPDETPEVEMMAVETAKYMITCVPEIFVFGRGELRERRCDWLMIGSDGIFDVLSPSRVMDVIRSEARKVKKKNNNNKHEESEDKEEEDTEDVTEVDLGAVAERVVKTAIEKGSKDNCTVVVMRLEDGGDFGYRRSTGSQSPLPDVVMSR